MDLIESKSPPGLFPLFDDVCSTMAKEKEAVADVKMLDKIDAVHFGHQHYKRTDNGFKVHHYAGEVAYNCLGFTARNKDLLNEDLVKAIKATTNAFLKDVLTGLGNTAELSLTQKKTAGVQNKNPGQQSDRYTDEVSAPLCTHNQTQRDQAATVY